MGEIADMMLEGGMCQWCGELLENAAGFPTICAGCRHQHDKPAKKRNDKPAKKRRKKSKALAGGSKAEPR